MLTFSTLFILFGWSIFITENFISGQDSYDVHDRVHETVLNAITGDTYRVFHAFSTFTGCNNK